MIHTTLIFEKDIISPLGEEVDLTDIKEIGKSDMGVAIGVIKCGLSIFIV